MELILAAELWFPALVRGNLADGLERKAQAGSVRSAPAVANPRRNRQVIVYSKHHGCPTLHDDLPIEHHANAALTQILQ